MSRSFSSSSRSFARSSSLNQSSLAGDTAEQFKKTGTGNNLVLNRGNLAIGTEDPGNAKLLVTGESHIMGRLGIGTKTPTKKLHIIGDINYTGDLFKYGNIIRTPWKMDTKTNNIYYNIGNIGLGTQTPNKRLEVIGDISFSGTLYQGNSEFTSGGGANMTIQEEGSSLSTAATTLNFIGSGVTASGTGTTKTITITGGGGGTLITKNTDVSLNNLYVHGDVSLNAGSIFSSGDISTNENLNVGQNIVAHNNVDIKNNLDICGNVDVYGNFTVHNSNLNYVNINSTNISISDNIIDIGYSDISNTYDKGLVFNSIKDNSNQALLWKYEQSSFVLANIGDVSGSAPPYNISTINNYSNLRLGKIIGEDDASFNKNVIIDGSMGISTTNPLEKLHVVGNLFVDGNNIWLKGRENNNESLRLYHSNTNAYIDWSGGNFYIRNNNSTKLLIKENGNIGIGTTNPTRKLEITGDISNSNNAYINGNIYSEGDLSLNSGNIFVQGNIEVSGNFEISGNSDSNVFKIKNNVATNGSEFSVNSNKHLFITNKESAPIRFKTSDSEQMRIMANGNIGIGTTNPTAKLDINGDISTNGILTIPDISCNNNLFVANKLGVGKNNPTKPLEVIGDISFSGNLYQGNSLFTSSSLTIQDEGVSLDTSAVILNFVGSGVSASGTQSTKTITINSIGGSGGTSIDKNTDVSLNNLYVHGDVSLNAGSIFSSGDISTNSDLQFGGNLIKNGSNIVLDQVTLDSLDFADTNLVNSSGTNVQVELAGSINDFTINGNLYVPTGDISTNNSLHTNNINIQGDISNANNIYSTGNIYTAGDLSLNSGSLYVSNKIGIGTQAPTKPLEIIGDISFSGTLYNGSEKFREQPIFLARGTSTASIKNTDVDLTWGTPVITNVNYYSLNSNQITFNSIGTYLIDMSVRTTNNNRSELIIQMYINGSVSANDIMSDYVARDSDQNTGGCSLHTALNVTNTTTIISFVAHSDADGNASLLVAGTNIRINKVF